LEGHYAAVRICRVPGISFDQSAYVDGGGTSISPSIPNDGEWLRETIIFALPEQGELIDYDATTAELAVPAGSSPWASHYYESLASIPVTNEPWGKTLFVHALHAARCNVKADRNGIFAGLAAGIGYSVPARTYFRDGYWTCLALLPFYPELVRKEILFLAVGINDDGSCPSGVIYPTPAGLRYWENLKRNNPDLARDHTSPLGWWDDHFDAPLFFVILVFDYIDATRDRSLLDERVGGATVAGLVDRILDRYRALEDANRLPVKPRNDRDWADNVFRGGAVTYDIALYYGALVRAAVMDPSRTATAEAVRRSATQRLWLEDQGYFAEFIDSDGAGERHLALETVTAIFFGLADADQEDRMVGAFKHLLYAANNNAQPYGHWGTMAVYPHYAASTRRRGKTLFPYRYHNGADWPYWDAIIAWVLLRRQDPDWSFPVSTYWEYGLSQGWPEAVEYYSPPYGHGSFLQAWSGLAARVLWEAERGEP
jgi:glycogen debranching enzyme